MDIEDDLIVEEEVVDVKQECPEPPLESRCRLCWNVPFNAENVFSLFDENDGQESLQSDLMTFFQLQVRTNPLYLRNPSINTLAFQFEDTPEYPSRVCGSCVDFMMDIKAFKNQIMASHSLFSKEIERVKEEAHDESYTDTTEHIQEDVEEDEVQEEEEEDDEKEKKPTSKLCKYCEKRYPTTKALKIHYKATHKGKPLECPTCGKVFKVLANFKKHKLIHLPKSERPHKCPHCESRFVGAGQLNIHIQRLHDVKERYMCEDCGRGFSTNSNLYDHRQNIHSGRRDPETGKALREKESKVAQPCPVCGEKFVNLSSHMVRMHKEGKPNDWSLFDPNEEVTCPVESCARVLSRLDMREHSKEHFVGKYCEYCFIRIKSPGLANRHINKHRGILFPCEHCDKVYDNDQGLYLHMRSRHTDVYEQTIKRQKR